MPHLRSPHATNGEMYLRLAATVVASCALSKSKSAKETSRTGFERSGVAEKPVRKFSQTTNASARWSAL